MDELVQNTLWIRSLIQLNIRRHQQKENNPVGISKVDPVSKLLFSFHNDDGDHPPREKQSPFPAFLSESVLKPDSPFSTKDGYGFHVL